MTRRLRFNPHLSRGWNWSTLRTLLSLSTSCPTSDSPSSYMTRSSRAGSSSGTTFKTLTNLDGLRSTLTHISAGTVLDAVQYTSQYTGWLWNLVCVLACKREMFQSGYCSVLFAGCWRCCHDCLSDCKCLESNTCLS